MTFEKKPIRGDTVKVIKIRVLSVLVIACTLSPHAVAKTSVGANNAFGNPQQQIMRGRAQMDALINQARAEERALKEQIKQLEAKAKKADFLLKKVSTQLTPEHLADDSMVHFSTAHSNEPLKQAGKLLTLEVVQTAGQLERNGSATAEGEASPAAQQAARYQHIVTALQAAERAANAIETVVAPSETASAAPTQLKEVAASTNPTPPSSESTSAPGTEAVVHIVTQQLAGNDKYASTFVDDYKKFDLQAPEPKKVELQPSSEQAPATGDEHVSSSTEESVNP
jgi:hypothetical protein